MKSLIHDILTAICMAVFEIPLVLLSSVLICLSEAIAAISHFFLNLATGIALLVHRIRMGELTLRSAMDEEGAKEQKHT